MAVTTEQLEARMDALELLVGNQQRQLTELKGSGKSNGRRKNGHAGMRGNAQPRWLTFVRWGGKPCAGGCGTTIPTGEARVFYVPDEKALYCQPCGDEREKAGA